MRGLDAEIGAISLAAPVAVEGRVSAVRGVSLSVTGLPAPVGSLVSVRPPGAPTQTDPRKDPRVRALGEVVGFDERRAIVMLLNEAEGLCAGDRVVLEETSQTVRAGDGMLGRVIDALGRPIDGRGAIGTTSPVALAPRAVGAMERGRVNEPLLTGVRVIDLMLSVGRGQRLGIFAGPGVGKSTLLGSIARHTEAEVSVIALIGERGREVREFVEDALGAAGLARSVVVVATGDESPLMRLRAARSASAIAEHFRDRGKHVLLMMDSVTRFAHAQRQVGLGVGEPPATKGYTPSVFAELPLLLERGGCIEGGGSITGLYTVLVEGDDMTEPIADATRGILDGHLILSRKLAQRGHYPAVDVLDSVSRVADQVSEAQLVAARRQARLLLASHAEIEELIQIGAYAPGSDPVADVAVAFMPRLKRLLTQDPGERASFDDARAELLRVSMESGELLRQAEAARAARSQQGAA